MDTPTRIYNVVIVVHIMLPLPSPLLPEGKYDHVCPLGGSGDVHSLYILPSLALFW